jgi:hypothetical protein
VTRSVVLNDRIFHLPSEHIDTEDLNRRLGDTVFVPLTPVGTHDELARVLWDIWYYAASWVTGAAGPSATPEAADSLHLMADTASFHGLTLEAGDWWIEPDSIGGFSSVPAALVRNLIDDPYSHPMSDLLLCHSSTRSSTRTARSISARIGPTTSTTSARRTADSSRPTSPASSVGASR